MQLRIKCDRQTYTYDANGNQTGWTDDKTGQRQKMVWDEENRLREVSVNGQLNSYIYDAAGERVLKAQGSGQSVFVNGKILNHPMMKLKKSLWKIRKRIIKKSRRKKISNSSNSFPRIALFIALCSSLQLANAQKKYDAHTDSLVKSFLIENNILLEPVHEVKYVKGKKVSETSNYYLNKRKVKVSDTSSVSLTVFGTLSSHLRDYLLIEYNTPGDSELLFVGQRLFEKDIVVLKSFFEKRQELPLAIKRTILEAFSKLN